jgi:hypothetical protein
MPIAPVRLKMRPIHGSQFYTPKYVDRENVTWRWVDDKAKLEEKGPRGSGSEENLAL